MIEIGQELPSAELAQLHGNRIVATDIRSLVEGSRCLVIGIPGGFTPVCTEQHLPSIASRQRSLRTLGIEKFLVLVPESPWVVAEWISHFSYHAEFDWYSDGNHDFARQCGLIEDGRQFFLGECSKRYAIQTRGTRVDRLSVEASISEVNCTSGESQESAAA